MFPGEILRVVGEDEPTGLAVKSPEWHGRRVLAGGDHKFGLEAPGSGPFIAEPPSCTVTVEPRNDHP